MTQPEDLHDALTGQHLTFLQTGRETGGEVLKLQVRLDPGGSVPRHAHVRQDEEVHVVEGAVTLRVGARQRTLGVGERGAVPRRRLHRLWNSGPAEAVFVLEVRPARRMEAAMRALFAVMRVLAPLARLRSRRVGSR